MGGLAHDVSRELRGYHGRWTKGAAMQRVQEAQVSEARKTTMHPHDEVKRQLEAIPMNGGKRINGVPTGRSSKGFYVAFPKAGGGRDSKSYKSSGHAARAVIEGRHHDENDPHEGEKPGSGGGFREKPPVPKPELKQPEAPKPSAKPEIDIFENPHNPGTHIVLVGPEKEVVGTVREYQGRFQAWEGGDYRGSYPTKEHAARILVALRKEKKASGEAIPKPQAPPDIAEPAKLPRLNDNELFRRSIPQRAGPFAGKPPDITAKGTITAGQVKAARVDVMSAKSMTSRYNGQLDAPVILTKQPHGHRAGQRGTTFGAYGASRQSQYRTQLHLHSGMWTRADSPAVYEREKSSGWWVPTDGDVPMGQAVTSHEYGHGVHDELVRAGVMSQMRSNNVASPKLATDPREQEFWRQMSEALGVSAPATTQDGMNVSGWFRQNQSHIKKTVSTYGGGTVTEMFAELWCEYCNNSSARPPAVVYGNYVRAMVGDVARKAAA
jgi:hypothetical protein